MGILVRRAERGAPVFLQTLGGAAWTQASVVLMRRACSLP